ncbi:hypothetical protein D3C78_1642700 [compost metagenome]
MPALTQLSPLAVRLRLGAFCTHCSAPRLTSTRASLPSAHWVVMLTPLLLSLKRLPDSRAASRHVLVSGVISNL